MSDNDKGTYVFDHRLLNKRLDELKATPMSEKDAIINSLIELSEQAAAIAESMMIRDVARHAYTDEEVRELARHLSAVLKQYDLDSQEHQPETIQEARQFLLSKKYFNVNESDLII